jgi:hypothetical protein
MSQQGVERGWWWKVAMHLDEAQLAINKVLAYSIDDPTPVHMLHGKLRESQAFLLEIFRWKGMLPGSMPSAPAAPAVVRLSPEHMPTVPMGVTVPQKYSSVVPEDAVLSHDTSLSQAAILPKDNFITSKIAEDGWILNDVGARAASGTVTSTPMEEAEPPTAVIPTPEISDGKTIG